ncbi:MAG: PspC domain-containing protein [Nocardioides sp.]|uniref:PspC domain-containing protein n=1 Tax=Nocardioides sp. TaxID=35761 RepID=UPI0039E3E22F
MTTIPPDAPTDPGPRPDDRQRPTADQLRDVRRLSRTVGPHRKVAGVAGGLARHLDIDPVILRVAFVVLALFGGGGILLYIALWLLLPDDEGSPATVRLDSRSLSVVLVVVGVIAALSLIGTSWGGVHAPWPVILIGLLVALVVMNRQPRAPQPPVAPPAPYGPPPAPTVPPAPGATAPGATSSETVAPATSGYDVPGSATATTTAPYAAVAPATPGYDVPAGAAETPPPYSWTPPTPAPIPPTPRKPGPILFWFTLALITLALGVLGIADVAGADISVSAYPALATALAGVMLVVGSFYGRAGGIILVGLLSAATLAGTTVGEHVVDQSITKTPSTSTDVRSHYWHPAGEMVLNLSEVSDPAALDGRTITVEGGAGRLVVIVPEELDVRATAEVDGPGSVEVFGQSDDGVENYVTAFHNVPDEAGSLVIRSELGVGQIEIRAS